MSWRELLNFLEPLIPFLGVAAILIAVAIVALAITGSMAALELTKYYRRQNRLQEEADRKNELLISERELKNSLQGAVHEAVAPLREDLGRVQAELDRSRQTELPGIA